MKTKSSNARRKGKLLAQPLGEKPSANSASRTATKPKAKRRFEFKSKKRILVVEDDPQSLELLSALLSEAGYQVDQADHALAAICAVARHSPDLVLADIRMPIIDGRELVCELKSHRDTQHLPVVAITGYDTPEMQESAFQAGYDAYITKPIDALKFLARIAKLLREYRLKRKPNSV